MIGGSGEKKTLRLVAKYADACNLYASDNSDVIRNKLEVLRRHCEAVGRDYEDIERTAIAAFDLRSGAMTPQTAIGFCRKLADAGIQHLIVSFTAIEDGRPIEIAAKEIIPAVRDL